MHLLKKNARNKRELSYHRDTIALIYLYPHTYMYIRKDEIQTNKDEDFIYFP